MPGYVQHDLLGRQDVGDTKFLARGAAQPLVTDGARPTEAPPYDERGQGFMGDSGRRLRQV